MQKRITTTFLMMVVGVCTMLLVAACTSDSANENANGTTSNENEGMEQNDTNGENNEMNEDAQSDTIPEEDVEILIMTHWGEDQYEHLIGQHLEDAFDHITVSHIEAHIDDLEELFAAQVFPDIIMDTRVPQLHELELPVDLYPLIEEANFDMGRLEEGIIRSLENISADGELNAIPFVRPEYALVYNQDLFDETGTPYPDPERMTWGDVMDLVPQLVTEDWYGLQISDSHAFTQIPDSILIDPDTHEPTIEDNEGFRSFLELLSQNYDVPGNTPETFEQYEEERGVDRLRAGTLAMDAGRGFVGAYADAAQNQGLNFDFAPYPVWGGEFGEYRPDQTGNGFVITSTSENQQAAFEVVSYLLSDEHQGFMARDGWPPAVVSQEVRDQFMMDHDLYDTVLQEKNMDAFFKNEPVELTPSSPYQGEILDGYNYREQVFEGVDVNTVLRELAEHADANYEQVVGRN